MPVVKQHLDRARSTLASLDGGKASSGASKKAE
jgi:hypothetical protein